MSKTPQFYCRQPRSVELIQAQPDFTALSSFEKPTVETRSASYSPDGQVFAYTQPTSVTIADAPSGEVLFKIDVADVFEFHFSQKGHYLATWSRPTKLQDDSGNWKDNVNIWSLNLKEKKYDFLQSYLNKSQSGWKPQFTADESIMCRMTNSYQIDFFKTGAGEVKKAVYSLNVKSYGKINSFLLSPGLNPSIAIFIPESSGKPSYIQVYSLPNVKTPTSQKQFFKGESCQFRWNDLGTSILALVSTDVDATNKSYYGESTLYLLGISGSFDQKIHLDKEGPIHDITWSPTSREFAVIYGYMPSQTTFFDSRGDSIYSLPPDSRNTILFSPHAKYILVAGFGNLQGNVEIFDRQNKFAKVASFNASNTSVCKWSPDGRYILTATTSPRLRVDNGVKIWYVDGTLCYVKDFSELYSADWRHQPLTDFPPIKGMNECCTPHISAIEHMAKKVKVSSTENRPTGAYRPPHARNAPSQPVRTLAQREAAQQFTKMTKKIPGLGAAPVKKQIPGATPVVPAEQESKAAAKNRKKRQNKKDGEDDSQSNLSPSISASNSPQPEPTAASLVIGGVVSYEEKKIRNLLKKLRAIEQLKAKKENGEFLEDTQMLKINTEPQVRKELESLGWVE
ncbi:hypothetical protein CANARDRAFT_7078 [[Candida] arabinofermentans NRRL YB-2248]|uniref:Eukaryotic translation initiation factor 2A n=1 Tax=[Candida] arabinofermentans NRRL YB-2248 TaxID=983967 RepID=A0A1E4T1V4_9ASCO|nr:hypothetical protein CANARDRAFT_7078 [[Candida] arabinofermentans NRRL YB-2248]